MTNLQRRPIPPTRLPFINQDVTPIRFRGGKGLVSSIWGGPQGGRIYLWNPDTREAAEFHLPGRVTGSDMLRTGPDGRLYLGCGNGELLRFDPSTETFQTLVTGELSDITFGGCVTDRHVVWTTPPGDVGVYDWRNDKLVKVFRRIDSTTPPSLYGCNVVPAPDGRVILGLNTPQARLVTLDLQTMTARSHTPPSLNGAPATFDIAFWNDTTLYIAAGFTPGECQLLRYPGFDLVARIPWPDGVESVGLHGCRLNGRQYICGQPAGDLFVLDETTLTWRCVCPSFSEGEHITSLAAFDDRLVCGVTVSGKAVSFDPQTNRRDSFELPAVGTCEARALCAVPEAGKVFGAPFISGRFWSIDLESGASVDHGPGMQGGGQIDFGVYDPRSKRVYFSSYNSASISVLDPARPIAWPDNPHHLASASDHEQMRDKALAFDSTHLWMGTSPKYGQLGGALCRIHPGTGELTVRRHIVADQTINSLVLSRDHIYCGSEIFADCNSTPPTQTHAKLICVDPREMRVVAETTIGDDNRLYALAMVGDELLAQSLTQLYLWNARTGAIKRLGKSPANLVNNIAAGADGTLWTSDIATTGRLVVSGDTARYEPIVDVGGRYLHLSRDGALWFVTDREVVSIARPDTA